MERTLIMIFSRFQVSYVFRYIENEMLLAVVGFITCHEAIFPSSNNVSRRERHDQGDPGVQLQQ